MENGVDLYCMVSDYFFDQLCLQHRAHLVGLQAFHHIGIIRHISKEEVEVLSLLQHPRVVQRGAVVELVE